MAFANATSARTERFAMDRRSEVRRGPCKALGLSVALLFCAQLGCERARPEEYALADRHSSPDAARLGPPPKDPSPREGMAWIPGGALVAGTRPDVLPRVADEEMPGEQVILKGFYIDVYPYPNEEGALSLTYVTQQEAAELCRANDKRLCTELEWERACKGSDNSMYEYGDKYSAEPCGTGEEPRTLPHGLRVGCQSGFGVRDLHGDAWEWTGSPWGRGQPGTLVTVRGGNGIDGELVGRCANARARAPTSKSGIVGFRCCAGPKNEAEVTLQIQRGPALERQEPVDRRTASLLVEAGSDEARLVLGTGERPNVERMWWWRPIGNERLVVLGGCSGAGPSRTCGVMVGRRVLNRCRALAWGSSGYWVPTVGVDQDPRDLWVVGADARGRFRVKMRYARGRVVAGPRERRMPRAVKKKRTR